MLAIRRYLLQICVLFFAVIVTSAQAQQNARNDRFEDTIIVTTSRDKRQIDEILATSILQGAELDSHTSSSLGDMLTSIPGVSSTSFAPGVSRPVIRGEYGERVRILIDGIGSIDVSNTSQDHAVTADLMNVDRFEVIRGPATLLYGASAASGVVNLIDHRLPSEPMKKPFDVNMAMQIGSASSDQTYAGHIRTAVANGVSLQVDGTYGRSDDLRTGGRLLSQAFIDRHEIDPDVVETGTLPNSFTRRTMGSVGLAWSDGENYIALLGSRHRNRYGIPAPYGAGVLGGHGHHEDDDHDDDDDDDEDHEEEDELAVEPVSILLHQTRFDLKAGFQLDHLLGGFFDKVLLRFGWSDYDHSEIESNNEVGSIYRAKGIEGRMTLVQNERKILGGTLNGLIGTQVITRDFESIGEEAFLPQNDGRQFGFFILEEVQIKRLALQAALRLDRTRIKTDQYERRFTAFSASAGAVYKLSENSRIGFNWSHIERNPSAEELFSDGAHFATYSYELGDPSFKLERSNNLEAFVRHYGDRYSFSVTGYHLKYDNYIHAVSTGLEVDDLALFAYKAVPMRRIGFEFEGKYTFYRGDFADLTLDLITDYSKATDIDSNEAIVRTPPLRFIFGLEADADNLNARFELEYVRKQNRLALNELVTQGYTMMNAQILWRPEGKGGQASLLLQARNITDRVIRRHSSYLKDIAPLAGLDVRLVLRVNF